MARAAASHDTWRAIRRFAHSAPIAHCSLVIPRGSLPNPELLCAICVASDVHALAALLAARSGTFAAVHRAAICCALAKARGERSLALELFALQARAWLAHPRGSLGREGREATNVIYSAARLRLGDGSLILSLAGEVAALAPTFNAQNAANSLWALATLGVAEEALVRPVAVSAALLAPRSSRRTPPTACGRSRRWAWPRTRWCGQLRRLLSAFSADVVTGKDAMQALQADLALGSGRFLSRAMLDRCSAK